MIGKYIEGEKKVPIYEYKCGNCGIILAMIPRDAAVIIDKELSCYWR